MDEISFDERTFGDGVPIIIYRWRMVPTEVSFLVYLQYYLDEVLFMSCIQTTLVYCLCNHQEKTHRHKWSFELDMV